MSCQGSTGARLVYSPESGVIETGGIIVHFTQLSEDTGNVEWCSGIAEHLDGDIVTVALANGDYVDLPVATLCRPMKREPSFADKTAAKAAASQKKAAREKKEGEGTTGVHTPELFTHHVFTCEFCSHKCLTEMGLKRHKTKNKSCLARRGRTAETEGKAGSVPVSVAGTVHPVGAVEAVEAVEAGGVYLNGHLAVPASAGCDPVEQGSGLMNGVDSIKISEEAKDLLNVQFQRGVTNKGDRQSAIQMEDHLYENLPYYQQADRHSINGYIASLLAKGAAERMVPRVAPTSTECKDGDTQGMVDAKEVDVKKAEDSVRKQANESMKMSQPFEKNLRGIRHSRIRKIFETKYLRRVFGIGFEERLIISIGWVDGSIMPDTEDGGGQWVFCSKLTTLPEPGMGNEEQIHQVGKKVTLDLMKQRNKRLKP